MVLEDCPGSIEYLSVYFEGILVAGKKQADRCYLLGKSLAATFKLLKRIVLTMNVGNYDL